MKTITNKFKLALVAVGLLAIGTVSAQTTTGDLTVQAATTLGNANGVVKLVDNKGTIKYLQSENGITSFTNTTPSGGVVTTWQLGGALTTNTTISMSDAGADGTDDQTFTIDGDTFTLLGTDAETGAAAVADAADTTDGIANTGYTVIVRDEATGVIRKTLASNIFQVSAIRRDISITTNVTTPGTENVLVTGLPAITAANEAKIFVFRNGVKLRWTTDFTGTTAGSIDINISADLPLYNGDVIEVQYIN